MAPRGGFFLFLFCLACSSPVVARNVSLGLSSFTILLWKLCGGSLLLSRLLVGLWFMGSMSMHGSTRMDFIMDPLALWWLSVITKVIGQLVVHGWNMWAWIFTCGYHRSSSRSMVAHRCCEFPSQLVVCGWKFHAWLYTSGSQYGSSRS